jgi:hypothetical protein
LRWTESVEKWHASALKEQRVRGERNAKRQQAAGKEVVVTKKVIAPKEVVVQVSPMDVD